MTLSEFLHHDRIYKTVEEASIICFKPDGSGAVVDANPLLWCRHIIAYYARMQGRTMVSPSMDSEQLSSIMAAVQTTFLGTVSWYWLGPDEQISKREGDSWHAYLETYTGPNKLFFVTTKSLKSTKSRLVVTVPALVDRDLFLKLSMMMTDKKALIEVSPVYQDFAQQIYKRKPKISLDTAMLLSRYAGVIGKNGRLFVEQWLPELVPVDGSLFSLSQALFAKQPRAFFERWKEMRHLYGMPFWIAFFAEQFWQAYAYVRLHKAGKEAEAKRLSYRLPFSFKNHDWRFHSLDDLRQSHHQVYCIDFQVKNGGSQGALELLFMRLFERKS